MTLDAEWKANDPGAPLNRPSTAGRVGRAKVSTVAEISHAALALFLEHGFDATTLDDVARAAGIGRRTFFRYFTSKNDLPWGDFEALIDRMRDRLAAVPDDAALIPALREAVIEFNDFPPEELPFHRQRMTLLLTVPSLMAHSTLRYAAWRAVIAEFLAARWHVAPDALGPQTVAWTFLAVSMSAYERWLQDDGSDLPTVLRCAYAELDRSLGDGHGP